MYKGYYMKTHKAKSVYLHRLILGVTDPKQVVDHIDHNGLNDRLSNLRIVEHNNNDRYRKSKNKNNKSGYRNVFWNSTISKWSVSLSHNYKQIHIGDYDDVDEAGKAAEEARQKYYKNFAGGN